MQFLGISYDVISHYRKLALVQIDHDSLGHVLIRDCALVQADAIGCCILLTPEPKMALTLCY